MQRWYARMPVDRDSRLASEALAICPQTGMPKRIQMAEALLGEL
jgi:hypothetical protein